MCIMNGSSTDFEIIIYSKTKNYIRYSRKSDRRIIKTDKLYLLCLCYNYISTICLVLRNNQTSRNADVVFVSSLLQGGFLAFVF